MPRNRKQNERFDSHGLPKTRIETVQTSAKNTTRTGTRSLLESSTTTKQRSIQNGHTLTQSTLMPEPAQGLTYTLRQRSDSLVHISALKKTCKSMGRYLEENPAQYLPAMPVNSDEMFMTYKGGRVIYLRPVAMFKSRGDKKTYGFIRFEGGDVKFRAESGWTNKPDDDEMLRDNQFWSSAVLQFCKSLSFKLPGHCWDQTEIGRYAACHVEKKLILKLICHTIYDIETGDIATYRLDELWERRLRAQIYIDKDPCNGCRNFALELGQVTGIDFKIIPAKTLVEAEWSKTDGKKQLQRKNAHRPESQLREYMKPTTRLPKKPVDYRIPGLATSSIGTSGGKRKRILDDDDDDETFVPNRRQSKGKRRLESFQKADKIKPMRSSPTRDHSEKPDPTYQAPNKLASNKSHSMFQKSSGSLSQLNAQNGLHVSNGPRITNDPESANIDLASSSTRHTKASSLRGRLMAQTKKKLPNDHAVPSERSRAIAELQRAKKDLLSRPVNTTVPVFHSVPSQPSVSRPEVFTTSDDSDSVSSRSSRTASPDILPITPPRRAIKALATPGKTPLKRYADGLFTERISACRPVTPSRSVEKAIKRSPTKNAGSLNSKRCAPQPVTPPKSTHKTKQTPTKSAFSSSRSTKRVDSRSIDLTTPEPSPLLKIKQFQYTPPSKTSKHFSEKKVPAVPFRLSHKR